MRGHDPILAMRKAGAVPSAVWFDLDGDGDAWRLWPRSMGVTFRRFPEATVQAWVLIEPEDSIARLDLRYVVGLVCHVMGSDAQRVHRLHQALHDAGAVRVLSSVMRPDARGDLRVVESLDSDGVLVGGEQCT